MRIRRLVLVPLLVLAVSAGATLAGQAAGVTPAPSKVIVCKYVSNENSPNGEVFGQVIDVSAESLDGFDPELGFTQTFTDNQGSSVAVRYATGPGDKGDAVTDCGQEPEVTPSPSPAPEPSESPSPEPTESPSPTVTPPGVEACTGSVRLSRFFSDPLISITLTGEGTFVITGGKLRRTDTHVVTRTLACGETLKVRRYHVMTGDTVSVTLDGVLVASKTAKKSDYR